jgi:ion channel-forming bestrophin family protein
LISFLPRYVNNPDMAKVSSADMAPLWQASEDGEYAYEHGITSRPGTRSATRTDSDFPAATLVGKPEHKGSWLGSFGSRAGSRRNSFYDPEKALPHVNVHRPLKPARCPPESTVYDYVPFLVVFKPLFSLFHKKKKDDARDFLGRKRKPQLGDSNVPLEITLYLSK